MHFLSADKPIFHFLVSFKKTQQTFKHYLPIPIKNFLFGQAMAYHSINFTRLLSFHIDMPSSSALLILSHTPRKKRTKDLYQSWMKARNVYIFLSFDEERWTRAEMGILVILGSLFKEKKEAISFELQSKRDEGKGYWNNVMFFFWRLLGKQAKRRLGLLHISTCGRTFSSLKSSHPTNKILNLWKTKESWRSPVEWENYI